MFPTFAFAGEDYDDVVSLIFLRARYYSPGLKRFISEDDFSGISTVPISLNRYIYCHNSPVSYVDPTGHIVWIPAVLIIGGLISAGMYHLTTPAEERSLAGYIAAFGIGAAATGAGMLVGHYVVGFLVGRGLSVALSQTIGGIASGAVAGAFETGFFDLLEGKPFWETVRDIAISAAISAGMGGLVPNLPGLRFRGPAPSLQWYRGWPIGGYVGPNTYRYLQQKIISRIESKISYRLLTIPEIFTPRPPPFGTLVPEKP